MKTAKRTKIGQINGTRKLLSQAELGDTDSVPNEGWKEVDDDHTTPPNTSKVKIGRHFCIFVYRILVYSMFMNMHEFFHSASNGSELSHVPRCGSIISLFSSPRWSA